MIVGIDGDVLRYELGHVALNKDETFGFVTLKPWPTSEVHELVDKRIQSIIEKSGANEFEVYLTGPGNFRMDVAKVAPYKGTRTSEKPHHWSTVGERLISHWGAKEVCGIEADDILAIRGDLSHKASPGSFVIASRDKDLRQVNCLHYAWACGEHQPEMPTYSIEGLGYIDAKVDKHGSYKLVGNGPRFFWAQLLTGDTIDNIKGCRGVGAKMAVKTLGALTSEQEMFNQCCYLYQQKYENWLEVLVENARLLWLIKDPSWLEVEHSGGHSYTYKVKQLWEIPYDLPSVYDSSPKEEGVKSAS